MRLTEDQIKTIRRLARQVAGSQSLVRVFGSRLDDAAHGGDINLMIELSESVDNPSLMSAQLSARSLSDLQSLNGRYDKITTYSVLLSN